ncbi:MAG TPA: RNA polymerase sigma factor SigJ [Solirubrobacterales bacterium]|nr:RNA polymerase sigma factor SigJ [Solirubrobacterales bacterium]
MNPDDGRQLLAQEFEQYRPHLRQVAYRMLGSLSEADDAVQEAWLRLNRSDSTKVGNLGGWLTTVVGRVSLDMLRTRRSRGEVQTGDWLPEPVAAAEGAETDPETQALMADSVGLALLVVLEQLSPAERLAFVLHDMFAVPFEEVAPIVERSPAAARQLASRARRRVRGSAPRSDADPTERRDAVAAFLAAARDGDFERLLSILDPEVVFRLDAGPSSPLARPPLRGQEEVARQIVARGTPFAPLARPASVNGLPGAVVEHNGRLIAVANVEVSGGRIVEIDIVFDQAKLRHVVID